MENKKVLLSASIFVFILISFPIVCITATVLTNSFLALLIVCLIYFVFFACPLSIFFAYYFYDEDDSKMWTGIFLSPCAFIALVGTIAYFSASNHVFYAKAFNVTSEISFFENFEGHLKFSFPKDCYFDPEKESNDILSGTKYYMNPLICPEGVYVFAYIRADKYHGKPSWDRKLIAVKYTPDPITGTLLKKLKESIKEREKNLNFSKDAEILYFGKNPDEGNLSAPVILMFFIIFLIIGLALCIYFD